MYKEYRGVWIDIYPGHCDDESKTYYWAAFGANCLGDRFVSPEAALFSEMQDIEMNRLCQ
ncbi:MAG: hypothetical protein KME60_03390 [Cyanomargarita calcarea GSE-NOS-MK-12-04C]|jgi:hypothetical protein|uniref:Uncharacterized protein n=1 Tax=Cyanomargarita calcarea GSE-NOS-MK-12-04C TaxID=2839659 RepID=A0A951QIG8_9CYAN|nr:hypothetical protein [Cyanomargarita calcarea GSE-NOS-MK-12-04C]